MCRYIDQIQLQHNCFSHVLGKAYQMILQSLLQEDHQKSVINTSLRSMSLQYRWSKVMKPTLLRNIFLILTFQEKKKKIHPQLCSVQKFLKMLHSKNLQKKWVRQNILFNHFNSLENSGIFVLFCKSQMVLHT